MHGVVSGEVRTVRHPAARRDIVSHVAAGPVAGDGTGRMTPIQRYLVAVAAVVVCTVLRSRLGPVLEGQGVYLFFMLAVALSAYVGGTGPGALAIALSAGAASPMLRPPFLVDEPAVAHLGLFLLESTALVELFRRLRRQEAALRATVAAADEARRSAEAASAAKEQLVARVSHEWRSPLNILSGWLWQIDRRPDDVALVRRAAASMRRATETQARLVADLLDFSRGSSGKLSIVPERIDVVEVIHLAVDGLTSEAGRRRVGISVTAPERGARVWADPVRLQQVFTNLLHNALKFTPADGRVMVTVVPGREAVDVTVRDTGAGIRVEALATIFDPFAQSDERRDAAQGGLGLGLTIVRQIVEQHGGSIRASSDGPGRGSAFSIRLPAASAEPA